MNQKLQPFSMKLVKQVQHALLLVNNLVVQGRVSCTLGQPQTRRYVAEDNPELLIFLPPPLRPGLTGFCHHVLSMWC